MTRYLDVTDACSLIKKMGIENVLTGMGSYIAEDFKRWTEFDKASRIASHTDLGVIELMPISDGLFYGFKYVNGHPRNIERGLSTVMAFGVLADVSTGFPILLSEMTLATALRTAATSAVAAQSLARKDSKSMAVIGCGAQAEFQITAFWAMLGIREIRLYDPDAAAIKKVMRNLDGLDGVTFTAATSVGAALNGADIVTTITADKSHATILTSDMIEAGMHINAVGGDCPGKTELHPDILQKARVVVEYAPQTRIEGDIQQVAEDFPVVHLWELLSGHVQARETPAQVTVFDSVGFALEDFSALRYFNDMSIKHNIGTYLNLVPQLPDPKDLFSLFQNVTLPVPPLKMAAAIERKQ